MTIKQLFADVRAASRPPLLVLLFSLCAARSHAAGSEPEILHQIQMLNQVSPEELSDKVDPGFSIIKTIYDQDGPDFQTLRKLLNKSDVRGPLNPSAKGILAGIVAQRWDTFTLSGNLYLAALRSPNPEIRNKARQKLVMFIQPNHIPVLIDTLRVPGPNILAYEVLQEVTGKTYEPNVKVWQKWWKSTHGKVDVVGHLLKDTRDQLAQKKVHPFDQNRFWYVPDGISNAHDSYSKRSRGEQDIITQWNDWANTDVKRYTDEWLQAKPVLERITHQPDPRVTNYLQRLVGDPGYGDYVSVVLAWRKTANALPTIQTAYQRLPTVGRALAIGSLGDRSALRDLLKMIQENRNPLSFGIMEDNVRTYAQTLHTVGVIPAEHAFELLTHHVFDFEDAATRGDKKKLVKKADRWLRDNEASLTFDKRLGYFVLPAPPSK